MPSDDDHRIDCPNDFNYWGNYHHRCPDHHDQSTDYHYHPSADHHSATDDDNYQPAFGM